MRKYKILDLDLMSFERIMAWTNRTKMFPRETIWYDWLSARRNKVSIVQAALVRRGVDLGLAQDMGSGPRRRIGVRCFGGAVRGGRAFPAGRFADYSSPFSSSTTDKNSALSSLAFASNCRSSWRSCA